MFNSKLFVYQRVVLDTFSPYDLSEKIGQRLTRHLTRCQGLGGFGELVGSQFPARSPLWLLTPQEQLHGKTRTGRRAPTSSQTQAWALRSSLFRGLQQRMDRKTMVFTVERWRAETKHLVNPFWEPVVVGRVKSFVDWSCGSHIPIGS